MAMMSSLLISRRASAEVPNREVADFHEYGDAVLVEAGVDATIPTVLARFGARYQAQTGTPLTWQIIWQENVNRGVADKVLFPMCVVKDAGGRIRTVYAKTGNVTVWSKHCPDTSKTAGNYPYQALGLMAGPAGRFYVPLKPVVVEPQCYTKKDCATLLAKEGWQKPGTTMATSPQTTKQTPNAPIDAMVKDARARVTDEREVLQAEVVRVTAELAAVQKKLANAPQKHWYAHWGWLIAAIVFFLAAAALGYSWYREHKAHEKLRTAYETLVKKLPAQTDELRIMQENSVAAARNAQEFQDTMLTQHVGLARKVGVKLNSKMGHAAMYQAIVVALQDQRVLAQSAVETVRADARTKADELTRVRGLLYEVEQAHQALVAEVASLTESLQEARAREQDREIAIAVLTQGRGKAAELLVELAEIISHLTAHRFTVTAMQRRLRHLKIEDPKRQVLVDGIASNERGIQNFLSQLHTVEDRLAKVLAPLIEASIRLTGHPPLDMEIIEQASEYSHAMQKELAAARDTCTAVNHSYEAARFEQRRIDVASAELATRSANLDERERAVQVRAEDRGVLIERVSVCTSNIHTAAIEELPSSDLVEVAGDKGAETSQVRRVVPIDTWSANRLVRDLNAINVSIRGQTMPVTPSLLATLGEFLTGTFERQHEAFRGIPNVGQTVPAHGPLWLIGQVWANLSVAERGKFTSPAQQPAEAAAG